MWMVSVEDPGMFDQSTNLLNLFLCTVPITVKLPKGGCGMPVILASNKTTCHNLVGKAGLASLNLTIGNNS